ncbi:thermonuclease family protein [Neisseria sp. Ec49-e6-T10]|uniref:thermonuclease family protein n=1 Tax=Neisseria sp. Ec49-e6-T10 TaxID=3140744 RepID=UPI003EC150EE
MKKIILLPILFLSFAQAETVVEKLSCKIETVVDGNTIICQQDSTKETITLILFQSIAPNGKQPYAKKAKDTLRKLLNIENNFLIQSYGKDQFGNILVTIFEYKLYGCGSKNLATTCTKYNNINLEMIKQGASWNNPLGQQFSDYQQAQEEAKKAKRGLWTEPNPIPPWIYRQMIRHEEKKQTDFILEEYRHNHPY